MPDDAPVHDSDTPDPKLSESDAELVLAKAELQKAEAATLAAEAKLEKAKAPLLDKLILRGLIPLALAIVGPWAVWTFSANAQKANEKADKVQETVVELQELLSEAQAEAARRRERFEAIERQKASELAAMGAMVTRLDDTLKAALVQMEVARLMREEEEGFASRGAGGIMPLAPMGEPPFELPMVREKIADNVAAQMAMPGFEPDQVKARAMEAYDRIVEQRQDQVQQEQD
jgi:hypothetical protein